MPTTTAKPAKARSAKTRPTPRKSAPIEDLDDGPDRCAVSCGGPANDQHLSIGELATQLAISTRTIRFYEARNLITPQRHGGARVYSRRDRARMQLILRGKNLGFTLDDIREYLRLYDHDPRQVAQTQLLLTRVETAIAALEHKKVDLERTLVELRAVRDRAVDYLRAQTMPTSREKK